MTVRLWLVLLIPAWRSPVRAECNDASCLAVKHKLRPYVTHLLRDLHWLNVAEEYISGWPYSSSAVVTIRRSGTRLRPALKWWSGSAVVATTYRSWALSPTGLCGWLALACSRRQWWTGCCTFMAIGLGISSDILPAGSWADVSPEGDTEICLTMLILLALVLAMSVNSCRRRLSDATQHQWRIQGGERGEACPSLAALKFFSPVY